ncbi:MAG: hypothetical protein ACRC06_00510, partial [Waterburya sp.]
MNQSRIENNVNQGTIADNKNINITTGSFLLTNGAILSASNLDDSETKISGDVKIEAKGKITLDKNARIFSNGFFGRVFLTSTNDSIDLKDSRIFTESENDIADSDRVSKIQITAPQGSISLNNSSITTENSGTGLAGDITLNTKDKLEIANKSLISSDGLAGRVFLTSTNDSIDIKDSLIFASSTNDIADPDRFSKIEITAPQGSIFINKSGINATNAPALVKLEGVRNKDDSGIVFSNRLSTDSNNPNDLAGKITINARDRIDITGTEIKSTSEIVRNSRNLNTEDNQNFSTIKFKVAEGNPAGKLTINQSEINNTN